MNVSGRLEQFLAFSSEITGFDVFDLQATGEARSFLDTVIEVVGEEIVDQLLAAYANAAHNGQQDVSREVLLRKTIFSDPKLGPVARNVVKLWYIGIWYGMPREWSDTFGARENDATFMVSAGAYTEALLWPAIGANPPGARGPGFGSWASPPRLSPEGRLR